MEPKTRKRNSPHGTPWHRSDNDVWMSPDGGTLRDRAGLPVRGVGSRERALAVWDDIVQRRTTQEGPVAATRAEFERWLAFGRSRGVPEEMLAARRECWSQFADWCAAVGAK